VVALAILRTKTLNEFVLRRYCIIVRLDALGGGFQKVDGHDASAIVVFKEGKTAGGALAKHARNQNTVTGRDS
jgi:hypothetical protein